MPRKIKLLRVIASPQQDRGFLEEVRKIFSKGNTGLRLEVSAPWGDFPQVEVLYQQDDHSKIKTVVFKNLDKFKNFLETVAV